MTRARPRVHKQAERQAATQMQKTKNKHCLWKPAYTLDTIVGVPLDSVAGCFVQAIALNAQGDRATRCLRLALAAGMQVFHAGHPRPLRTCAPECPQAYRSTRQRPNMTSSPLRRRPTIKQQSPPKGAKASLAAPSQHRVGREAHECTTPPWGTYSTRARKQGGMSHALWQDARRTLADLFEALVARQANANTIQWRTPDKCCGNACNAAWFWG